MLQNHKIADEIRKFFTKEEADLIDQSAEANTALTNQRLIAAQIYSAKILANANDELRMSNEKIARSNDHYTFAMIVLTGGLFFVGLVQMFIQAIEIFGKSPFVYLLFVSAVVILFYISFRNIGRNFKQEI